MKKLLSTLLCLLTFNSASASPSHIIGPNDIPYIFQAPDVKEDFTGGYCEDNNYITDAGTNITYRMNNCSTTPVYTQVFPILPAQMDIAAFMKTIMGSANIGSMKTAMFTDSASLCVKGDGSVGSCGSAPVSSVFGRTGAVVSANGDYTTSQVTEGSNLYYTDERAQDAVGNIITGGGDITVTYNDGANTLTVANAARAFNYPSRALNSCFQISASRDADFHYKVDVSSGTLLSGTVTGTVTATSYTNSGCTTGAQVIADGAPSQGAALGVLSISQIAPVGIDGMLQSNHWMKITTANTSGSPTFAIRAVQAETLF